MTDDDKTTKPERDDRADAALVAWTDLPSPDETPRALPYIMSRTQAARLAEKRTADDVFKTFVPILERELNALTKRVFAEGGFAKWGGLAGEAGPEAVFKNIRFHVDPSIPADQVHVRDRDGKLQVVIDLQGTLPVGRMRAILAKPPSGGFIDSTPEWGRRASVEPREGFVADPEPVAAPPPPKVKRKPDADALHVSNAIAANIAQMRKYP